MVPVLPLVYSCTQYSVIPQISLAYKKEWSANTKPNLGTNEKLFSAEANGKTNFQYVIKFNDLTQIIWDSLLLALMPFMIPKEL